MEAFKKALNIVEVISIYLPLQKSGANYSACCPFHKEKSASFMVSPAKNIFHCFGCGEGGDAIDFVQKFKNISFVEAVNELALSFSLPSPLKDFSKKDNRKELSKKLKALSARYTQNLLLDKDLLSYCALRGFNEEDIKAYELGKCAGGEWKDILTPEEALILGIINENKSDFFAHRLTLALFSQTYQHIGFVGRTHPFFEFKNAPKYINSKASFLFDKSKSLYNLARAKSHINRNKKILIVEGYFDALSAIKLGIPFVVATGGVAFNLSMLATLAKFEAQLVFLFDKDSAGIKASTRAIEVCFKNHYFNVFKGELKNSCKDLGEVLEKREKLELAKKDALIFYIKENLKDKRPEQKDKFLQEFADFVSSISNYFIRTDLLERIKRASGFDILSKNTFKLTPTHLKNIEEAYKAILSYKELQFCASEYFSGEEFEIFSNSFKNFIFEGIKDRQALELELREDVELLSLEQGYRALFSIAINFYKRLINEAKNRQNFAHARALSQKLSEFKLALKQKLEEPDLF